MIERVKSAMVGLGAGWVLILMLVLSVVSLAIMLERAWLYWSLRDDVPTLMRDLGRLLRGGDLDGARKRLEASPSAEAAVVIAGIVEAGMGHESAEEAMLGASALQKLKLEGDEARCRDPMRHGRDRPRATGRRGKGGAATGWSRRQQASADDDFR